MKKLVGFAVLCALAAQGCATHASFPRGLRRSARLEDRIAFYQRYRRQPPMPAPLVGLVDSVVVDGERVERSEDLVPLVGRRSRVREHSQAALRRERTGDWILGGGIALASLSTAGSFVLLGAPTSPPSVGNIAVSAVGTAGLVVALVGVFFRSTAISGHSAAFAAYDDDLLLRLGLCLQADGTPIDCAQPSSAQPSPRPSGSQPTAPREIGPASGDGPAPSNRVSPNQ